MSALAAEGLTKRFGGLTAVRSVDLAIEAGQCRAIIGPNGAGKTTLFHLLSGVERPTAGHILLHDEDVTRLPAHVRATRGLGRTFQITSLFGKLTVEENVLLAAQTRGARFAVHRAATSYAPVMTRVDQALEQGGLAHKRHAPVRLLSHGEQRQLEVIVALAMDPKVLLLDEPTAGLSEAERQSMTAYLQRLRGAVTIVLVSHDVDVAFALADAVTVLHLGEVLLEGSVETVRRDPRIMDVYLGEEVEQQYA
jgi:branched-chain amino acid transport system ATP-binding protein